MKIFALTQSGINKKENEDRIIVGKTILTNGVFQCDGFTGVFAIADGVGGNNAGAVASHFVANHIGEIKNCSKDFFELINHALISESNSNKTLHKMATTLSGVFCDDTGTKYFHIGNTRIYSLQSRRYLKQITEDDTTLNYLIKTGKLSSEDAEEFPDKTEITACFGGGNEHLFDFEIANIADVQTFLITSDGVHEYVNIDELEEILQNEDDFSVVCRKIADKAILDGSQDDISVLIACVEEQE